MNFNFDWLKTQDAALYERATQAQARPLDVSIRVNTLKIEAQAAMEKWNPRYGWQSEPVPFCPSGFWLRSAESAPSSTLEHRLGYYYMQEAASMLPAELFNLEEMERPLILDMAASPGGKTIHLADRSRDRGFILANDASRGRLTALRIVLNNWGVINQAITCLPGEVLGTLYPEKFDAVLLDAPCSMQGLRASPSHKARSISVGEVEALAARQARLLESALKAVKCGGQVVYSTCTLTPQENEGVLAEVLGKCGRAVSVVDISTHLPQAAPGLRHFLDLEFPAEVERAARLWPHLFDSAGFFAAKLIKTDNLPPANTTQPIRSAKAPDLRRATPTEVQGITRLLEELYGFDLGEIIQTQALAVCELKGELWLLGEALLSHFKGLPWISSGMPLGKTLPQGWQPSHEFVSRFGDRFTRGLLILAEGYLLAWQRGEDIRPYSGERELRGKVCALRDESGRNLGRGKLLEDRLKNLLPTRIF